MTDPVITVQPGQTIQIADPSGAVPAAVAQPQAVPEIPPPPPPPGVQVADRFFASLDGVVVAMVIALVVVMLARLIQSLLIHLALRKAITANHGVAAELADKLNRPFEPAGPPELPGDDRNGLVLVAIGLAMGCAGWVAGEMEVLRIAVGAAFFPLFVGIALLLRRRMVLRAMAREAAAD